MATLEHPITRSELQEELQQLRSEIRGELQELREDFRRELGQLREEFRDHYATKADLAQLETRLTKWMIGLMAGSIAIASTIALLVQRLAG